MSREGGGGHGASPPGLFAHKDRLAQLSARARQTAGAAWHFIHFLPCEKQETRSVAITGLVAIRQMFRRGNFAKYGAGWRADVRQLNWTPFVGPRDVQFK